MESRYIYSKIIVIGSGKLAYNCAKEALKYIKNICVYELKLTESSILEKMCIKDFICYKTIDKAQLTEILQYEQEDTLIVSAGSVYLIPKEIIKKSNFTIINWHNALLPFHKGRNAEAWAIFEGDENTGITWHYVVEAIDQGEIIIQKQIQINSTTTSLSLLKMQYEVGFKAFTQILPWLLIGNIHSISQSNNKERIVQLFNGKEEKMHYSYEIPNEGYFNFCWDFKQASQFLRAMDYGSLNLLGEIKIEYDGKEYFTRRYKIEANENINYQNKAIWMNEKRALYIFYDKNIIIFKELRGEK